jgi:UDPglucose 6-dehydrogenase
MEGHFGSLKDRTIAVWGLSFKPRTDDMREAPAIAMINGLVARHATVQAYDPQAARVAKRIFGNRIVLTEKGYDDGRNIYSPEQMKGLGFTYFSIGR